jgi:uncharacterized OB-fold protein
MTQPPLPEITDVNRPFWESLSSEVLRLQQCANCGHIRYPISEICSECLSEEARWTPMSGRGTVFSTIVFHQVYHPAFAGKVPYNVSLVRLDEGPIMVSNVVGPAPSDVAVGDRVEVLFDHVGDDVTIPRFRPAGGTS